VVKLVYQFEKQKFTFKVSQDAVIKAISLFPSGASDLMYVDKHNAKAIQDLYDYWKPELLTYFEPRARQAFELFNEEAKNDLIRA